MGFEGGRDDDVLSRAQTETLRHLPQVDVGFAASFGSVVQEEVFGKMLLVALHLWLEKQARESRKLEMIYQMRKVKIQCENAEIKSLLVPIIYLWAKIVVYSLGTNLLIIKLSVSLLVSLTIN